MLTKAGSKERYRKSAGTVNSLEKCPVEKPELEQHVAHGSAKNQLHPQISMQSITLKRNPGQI